MKPNSIYIIIACGISALLAFSCYSICDNEELRMLLAVGSFIIFLSFAIPSLGIKIEDFPRISSLLKVTSITFWGIGIITNLIFSFCNFNKSAFIIINGMLLLIFILTYTSLYKTKQ